MEGQKPNDQARTTPSTCIKSTVSVYSCGCLCLGSAMYSQRKEGTIRFLTSDYRHAKDYHRKALISGIRSFIGFTHWHYSLAMHSIESLFWLLCKAAQDRRRHNYPWSVMFK